MLRNIKDNKGFSLVELIVAIAIIGTVFSLVAVMVAQSTTTYGKIMKKTNYVNAASNITNEIKNQLINTKYLTIADNKDNTNKVAKPQDDATRIYADSNYDGIWLQKGTGSASHIYTQTSLGNIKTKLTFKADGGKDGKYSSLKVYLAFYEASVANTDIANDGLEYTDTTVDDLALYRQNSTIYIPSLAFGIRLTGGTYSGTSQSFEEFIEQEKTDNAYDTKTDEREKTKIVANAYNKICKENKDFSGTCIKFRNHS
jgi:prepilin-type N-terminal cleavage/methylation domain-containing protein